MKCRTKMLLKMQLQLEIAMCECACMCVCPCVCVSVCKQSLGTKKTNTRSACPSGKWPAHFMQPAAVLAAFFWHFYSTRSACRPAAVAAAAAERELQLIGSNLPFNNTHFISFSYAQMLHFASAPSLSLSFSIRCTVCCSCCAVH